jgi:hypothetical protein
MRKKESSFCEQKEAKKLHPLAPDKPGKAVPLANERKSFCFFFFRKRRVFLKAVSPSA